ncbi:hypothetical protein NDA14_000084 [Ustilago hordei]|nr:hypothetical protein NDA14_000084 [Ustilago hordei]
MKRWKQVKEQLDAKRNAPGSSNNNDDHTPPYKGGGISSASFSDLRELRSGSSHHLRDPSSSSLLPPMQKSTSRTSLDIPGRLSNFMNKSASSLDLNSAAAGSNKTFGNALRKFPRPRVRSNSNNFSANDAATNISPSKASPRMWVNSLLNQAGPSTQHLETAAQARSRAESDASRPSPAPVSSLVLSNDGHDNAASTSRQVYTLDSGLQRNTSAGGRSASIYSSHLSSASRSTPDLHHNSITRHRDNGALLMDLAGPLPSIAQREDNIQSPLVVRNLDEAPRGTSTPAIPATSASARLQTVSRLRNPWSANLPQIRSEEDEDVDASIAHDRSTNQLGLGEQAVLDMLESASGVGSAVSALVPPTPYQTATPGTLARSRSFANTTRFHSPASEYSQDFKSPFLAGTSSPAAGVREAIRQREILDSAASINAASKSQIVASRSTLSPRTIDFLNAVPSDGSKPLRSNQTSTSAFYQRNRPSSSTDDKSAFETASQFKRISRVPVPTTEIKPASPPTSASSNVFYRHGTVASTTSHLPISPIDSSLLGSSAHATSLWSRPGNGPDTPSTTQESTSPMLWSASSLAPPKWPSRSQHSLQQTLEDGRKSMYSLEPVVTSSSIGEDEERFSDLQMRPSTLMPNLRRHRTDFTEATSIFSGADAFQTSQNSLEKGIVAETVPAMVTTTEASTTAAEASATAANTTASRPLSHAGSVSSSLAAIRGMFSKAASSALPLTGSVSVSNISATDSPGRSAAAAELATSTSVAAAAKDLENRSSPLSRPSSPEKLSIPSSPTKAKDLIKMFESNSATGSPVDQSHSISRVVTPRRQLSPTKCGTTSAASSLNNTPKRQTPLAISVSRSNLGRTASNSVMDVAAEEASPVASKLQARRFEAGRFRSRRAGLIGVGGGDGGGDGDDDASFGGYPGDENDDEENVAPDSSVGDARSAHSRFRSLGVALQHTRSQSTTNDISGNVLSSGGGGGDMTTPAKQSPTHGRTGSNSNDRGSNSMKTSPGSLGGKGAFRNSVIGFMGVLSGKPANDTAATLGQGGGNHTLNPSHLLSDRRNSAKSDQDDNLSTTSAATQGTTASYRRKKEEGNLPLSNTTAIQMSNQPPGAKPIRAGVLYYFNVHSANPRWLRVKAVLLPSAVAMSWIPSGGGRENVVLDLRACREVHSVPSPDHPSSASDVGAASARRQGLESINPFQLIFDDGVERLAADSAKERVQWVTAVWDVTGTGSPPADSVRDLAVANLGRDAVHNGGGGGRSVHVQASPTGRSRGLADVSSTRPLVPSLGAGVGAIGSPKRPASMRPESTSNEEAIDRIGSIWKSELSSELTNKDMQASIGEALASAASVPPPLPPKEPRPALSLGTPNQASKSTNSVPTGKAATAPTPVKTTVSAPLPIATSANSPARSKVRSWQRPPLDLSTGYIHDLTPKTLTLVTPVTDAIHSTPALYAKDKSTSESLHGSSTKATVPEGDARERSVSLVASSPDMDGYESARSQGSRNDEFGPRTPVSEAVFNWSRLDKESDLNPSDSASQRPARSEYGTVKSNVFASERKKSAGEDSSQPPDASGRTPAQLLRDTVLGTTTSASPTSTRPNRLGTVIEETQSQAQSTRINASIRSTSRSKLEEMITHAIGNNSIKSPAAKFALSLVSSGSISSQDVGKLLEILEEEQRERQTKEKELEDQIRSFQQVISDLQKKNSTSSSHRRRSSTTSVGGESKVSARDSELAAMQEKLDKVLGLVTNVVAAPSVYTKAKSESATLLSGVQGGEEAELARIESVLAKLLRKMHVSAEETPLSPRSHAAISSHNLEEWHRMPSELRGTELIKSIQDRAQYGKDGRHEAIQTDYQTLRNVSSDMVRGGRPPAGPTDPGTPIDGGIDPKPRFSRRASEISIATTITDVDGGSMISRIPPRSWSSERGIPSPPPNSEWDSKSLISRPASRATTHLDISAAGARPAQNFRMLADPSTPSNPTTPRPVMVKGEPSYDSLDMEAEIRRRRAQQRKASGAEMLGGWYTPKAAQVAERGLEGSSVTAEAVAVGVDGGVDKPVPPTPSVRWASGDIVPVDGGKTPDGLGLSMSSAPPGEAKFSGPPPTPGVGYAASSTSTTTNANTELATILQALKASEQARQTQLQQQTEISRYLNELNAWLERDVVDRSKEWRTLASGVTQLHDELKALKEGITLPASGSGESLSTIQGANVAVETPTMLRPGVTGAVPAVTERGSLAKVVTMGDSATVTPSSPTTSAAGRKRPAGTRKWNESRSESPSAPGSGAETWYKPDDAPTTPKSRSTTRGALLIRSALREWERFKTMQRSAGKPEAPLPLEATGNPAIDSQLPLPESISEELKNAADAEDNTRIGELVRASAEAGYGTQAIIELTRYVESKPAEEEVEGEVEVEEEEEVREGERGVVEMATPIPAKIAAAKAKAAPPSAAVIEEEERDSEPISNPTTEALALAVEEILKHLLSSKEEAKRSAVESEQTLLSLKEKEKAELVDLLYSRISADRAAEEAKAKELDPKSAIENLVAAINSQKEVEVKSAAAADAALRQMTSELLTRTSEQNQKLVEAVNAASRDMLKSNVQMHAEEFKRLLHKEVSGMFEDVGKIREVKRQMEFEIADLWSIKSRHLQQNATGLIGFNVSGAFPSSPPPPQPMVGGYGGMPMPMPVPMGMPMPMHPPAHISPIPPPQPAPAPVAPGADRGIDSLKAQKKAVKAALKQAVADSTRPVPAPIPAAATLAPAPAPANPVASAAQVAATGFLAKRKDVLNPFSINFGPRAPVAK